MAAGLSQSQQDALKSSWQIVAADLVPNGVALFQTIFQQIPASLKFFAAFEGLSLEEIEKSEKMQSHALNFNTALGEIVNNVDNAENFEASIKKLTETHTPRSIGAEEFKAVNAVMLSFLEAKLGDKMDSLTKESWEKTLAAINDVVAKA